MSTQLPTFWETRVCNVRAVIACGKTQSGAARKPQRNGSVSATECNCS